MTGPQEFQRTHDYPCWCGQFTTRKVCEQMFGRRRFLVLECTACGTHRILPKALNDQTAAQVLYNEYLGPDLCDGDRAKFAQKMLKRLAETRITFAKGKKVLDVGCGSGVLLEAICQQFGCTGKGIDVDSRRIEKARTQSKLAVFERGLFDARNFTEGYDILTCSAVIEHVVNPLGFLKELNLTLAEGGSLFLLTPNAASLNYRLLRSWWRELLSIGEHIYLFTPESLEECSKLAGFELIQASSDFDRYSPSLSFGGLKNTTVSLWALYREFIKRASAQFASARTGDILYAHFRKVSPGSAFKGAE